jgi:hypothetical protein
MAAGRGELLVYDMWDFKKEKGVRHARALVLCKFDIPLLQ